MPHYRVLEKSYIDGKIVEAGATVQYTGAPGANLELMCGEEALISQPPTQPVAVDTNPLPGIRVRADGKYIAIWCQGCKETHAWIPINGGDPTRRWTWNGRTLDPSVRHFNPADEETKRPEITTCHYNVTNGRIFYHNDSSAHTVRGEHDLQPFPEGKGP